MINLENLRIGYVRFENDYWYRKRKINSKRLDENDMSIRFEKDREEMDK